MKKQLLFREDIRKKLLIGVQKLADAVTSTLGPRSYNVVIDREYPAPLVVHDGVTVAREIVLEDPFENMGAKLVMEAASRTNDLAGDGTTTATLLAATLYKEGLDLVSGGIREGVIVGKYNPMKMREALLTASEIIVSKLQQKAKPIEITSSEFENVAKVSAGLGTASKVVIDAVRSVGKDGVIMIEESGGFDTYFEHQEGYEFDNGMLSPYLATDAHKMIAQFKDSYVLITDAVISDAYQIVDIVQAVKDEGKRSLIIIADTVTGPALQTLVLTKLQLGFQVVAVNAPEFGDTRRAMLEDLAMLTGATPFFMDVNHKVKEAKLSDLGIAKSVLVTQTHTTIAAENTDTEDLKDRIASIEAQLKTEENHYRVSRLEKRVAKLKGGMAIIYAGGATITERKEIKERIIDAVSAVKAATAEGIVAGGGVTLRDIAQEITLGNFELDIVVNELVSKALNAPYEKILENAGLKSIDDAREGVGINVVTGEEGDMLKMGIVDPVKVTRLAVANAFSVAAMLLTTNVGITEVENKDVAK